jgi:hypothetical protein
MERLYIVDGCTSRQSQIMDSEFLSGLRDTSDLVIPRVMTYITATERY